MRLSLLLLIIASSAQAAEPVVVKVRDKPPIHYFSNGQPAGPVFELTRRVFEQAGIPAHYISVPPKRILAEMQASTERACSISWYWLPEREAFASFSLPIHRDPPHLLVANIEALPRIKARGLLHAVLHDTSLTLGAVDGVSYGPQLDAAIAARTGGLERTTVTPAVLAKKVAIGRVDFMFMDQEDFAFLREADPATAARLQALSLPDMPAGQTRHIMCGKAVTDDEMARLDHAIRKLATIK